MQQKILSLMAGVTLAVGSAACGGGGGDRSSSSSPDGSTSTLSGNLANEQVAMGQTVQKSLLARVLKELSPISTAYAGRNGVTVSVDGIEVVTDALGFFQLDSVPAGNQVVSFDVNGEVFTLEIDLPEDAVVRLENVALDPDGVARPDAVVLDVLGQVSSALCDGEAPMLSLLVGTEPLDLPIPEGALIRDGGLEAACSALEGAIGEITRVFATLEEDGSWVLDRADLDLPEVPVFGDQVFGGTVVALDCPDSITVERPDGELVEVALPEGSLDGAVCEDLLGETLDVEGIIGDALVVATSIVPRLPIPPLPIL